MELQIFNIFACAAGLLILVLSAYSFYKAGWHARNLEQNNYLHKQLNYYKELYEKEKDARKQTVIRQCKTISGLQNKITTCENILKEFADRIDPAFMDEHFPHLKNKNSL